MSIKRILKEAAARATLISVQMDAQRDKYGRVDLEEPHCKMDDLLCETIERIGEEAGCPADAKALIDAYNSTPKWYA